MKVFIINPFAGGGNSGLVAEKLELLKEEDWLLEYSKEAGDSTKLARKYKNEAEIIYSVGGDGTLNEIVNGMIGGTAMLGVIPAGSGNDFYKTVEDYPETFESDLGLVNGRYFINVASVGIDAQIAKNANEMKKNCKRNFKYIYKEYNIYLFPLSK